MGGNLEPVYQAKRPNFALIAGLCYKQEPYFIDTKFNKK